MGENPLSVQSLEFSIRIVEIYKFLTTCQKENILSKQLLRSGTSIGANIHEANYAVSRADFISKMQIALKEASETEYWLILLKETSYLHEDSFTGLQAQCVALKRMLTATLNTAKK